YSHNNPPNSTKPKPPKQPAIRPKQHPPHPMRSPVPLQFRLEEKEFESALAHQRLVDLKTPLIV
ncbi:hypothetical protein, partial [Rhizobium sp. Root149]|uniref:hypothetical protein n=1 Tax=Rhizobium sp. Root149 TaxID=1736473 RepID=UPI001AECBB5C